MSDKPTLDYGSPAPRERKVVIVLVFVAKAVIALIVVAVLAVGMIIVWDALSGPPPMR
jgi:hypothetical protein